MAIKTFKIKSALKLRGGISLDSDITTGGSISATQFVGDGSGLTGVTSYTKSDFDSDFASKNVIDSAAVATIIQTVGAVDSAATMSIIDSDFGTRTTDQLSEGSTNLYYTDARFDSALSGKSTSDLSEGTNLYYTDARADSAFDVRLDTKTTDNLAEGTTNKYYDTSLFNTDLGTKSTTDLTEGSNLYYTDARFDSALSGKSTSNLSEGSNLYYTSLRADSDAKNAISVGTNTVTFGAGLSYNSTNGQLAFTGPDSSDIQTVFSGDNNITVTGGQITLNNLISIDSADFSKICIHDQIHFRLDSHGGELLGEIYTNTNDGFVIQAQGLSNPMFTLQLADSEAATPITYYQVTRDGGFSFENNKIRNVAEPTAASDVATKSYVDGVAQGLHAHEATRAATISDISNIGGVTSVAYNNGTSGVGAFLDITGSLDSVDGVALTTDDRVLIKDQSNLAQNGIYTWDSATRLTRAIDFDTSAEIQGGDFVFNLEGTTNANSGFVHTKTISSVGDSDIVFYQFSGGGSIEGGDGLTLTGTVLSVNVGAGLTITSDTIKIPTNGIDDTMIDFGTGVNQVNTDDVPQGSTNKYYSDTLVDSHLAGGTGITYSSGSISLTNTIGADSSAGSSSKIPVLSVNAQGQITGLAEANIAGIVSLGYNTSTGQFTINASDAQAYSANITLQPFTTDNLTEGSSNLYYNTLYADSDFDVRFPSSFDTRLNSKIGTDVQAHNSALDDISGLAKTDGNIIVANGTNWVAESGNTARTSLGISYHNLLTVDSSGNASATSFSGDGSGLTGVTGAVPTGCIIMWSGIVANIPSGWLLCDGTNGTPDLRGRFVLGAGGTYSVGDSGGQESITDVPSHSHNLSGNTSSGGDHTHTGSTSNTGAHTHGVPANTGYGITYNNGIHNWNSGNINTTTSSAGAHSHNFTTASGGAHTHTLSGTAAATGSASVDIRPPYYALCYIMKD